MSPPGIPTACRRQLLRWYVEWLGVDAARCPHREGLAKLDLGIIGNDTTCRTSYDVFGCKKLAQRRFDVFDDTGVASVEEDDEKVDGVAVHRLEDVTRNFPDGMRSKWVFAESRCGTHRSLAAYDTDRGEHASKIARGRFRGA